MRKKRKNTVFEGVKIESMAAEGKCVARVGEKVIFIKEVAPGDVADIQITRKKKSFLEGIPIKFHEYSDKRTEPFCEHFGICGGCKWQHINYETQLFYKRQQVIDSLERIAKVPLPEIQPILSSKNTRYYRNKMEYTFTNRKWLTPEEIKSGEEINRDAVGFHIPGRFDWVIDIEECHLQEDVSNKIRVGVKKFAKDNGLSFYDILKNNGLLRILIVRITSLGEIMVIVQFGENDKPKIDLLLNHIKEIFPEITSLQYVINTKKNDTFNDLEVKTFSGKSYITEQLEGLKFRIGPKSFFQTNSQQALELYKVARDFAALNGDEIVYDLYTGTGTIANFVAKNAKTVIGLEYVEDAIKDAKVNSEINSITNTDFFSGDIKDLLNEDFLSKHGQPDVIITDPPRAGMHADVVGMLLKTKARKIVYISCNPATQARDVALLDAQYRVTKVQPVDMFPQTHHVENIVLLELKN